MTTLKPTLRFSEFSKIWTIKSLGEIGIFSGGGTPETGNLSYWGGEIQWFTPTEIKRDYVNRSLRTITDLGLKKSSAKLLEIGTILITTRATLGDVAITTKVCSTNQGFQSLTVYEENYNVFIFNWLKKNKFELVKRANGSTFPEISKSEIEQISLLIPSLPEQTKIANFLTATDQKIEILKEKKSQIQQYKKGIMQQLFSQEIRFKNNNGKDYPDWEVKSLGELGNFIGGGTPETGNSSYWGGEIQWFTPTEIKRDYVENSLRTITDLGLKKSSAKLLEIGTILITTRATLGDVAITTKLCSTNQGFQSLTVYEENCNVFIFNWLKENKFELVKRANGSTFPEISKSEIEQISLSIPSLPEQIKIANFLTAIDEKIEKVNQQINDTQTFKKGLLQQMFC
jgi:type I restriction enzyme, S subunit